MILKNHFIIIRTKCSTFAFAICLAKKRLSIYLINILIQLNSSLYPYMYIYFNDHCCYVTQVNDKLTVWRKVSFLARLDLTHTKSQGTWTRTITTVVIIGNFLDFGNRGAGRGKGLLTSPIYTVASSLRLQKNIWKHGLKISYSHNSIN